MKFDQQKWKTFFAMYLGYTMIYINRKSFVFTLPVIIRDLHFTKSDAGIISTSQHLSYTLSKFGCGILSDHINAKYFFSMTLFLTGIFCTSLSAFQTVSAFSVILFLQGLSQGGGWPSCTILLKNWFPTTQYGTWYSVINTSMNTACIFGPILVAFLTMNGSWNNSPRFIGILTMFVFLLCFFLITNSPNQKIENNKKENDMKGRGSWRDLRSNFAIFLCFSEFVSFLARTTLLEWAQLFIIYELQQEIYIGSLFISAFEFGGIIGSLMAGYVSDRLVIADLKSRRDRNTRLIVSIFYVLLSVISLFIFIQFSNQDSSKSFILICALIIGMGIYGAIVLFGVMTIEAAPPHLVGTAQAIVALFGSVGNIFSGIVFTMLAELTSWYMSFLVLELILIILLAYQVFALKYEYKMTSIKKRM